MATDDTHHPLPARTVAGWFLDTHQDIDPKHLDALTDLVRRARNDVVPATGQTPGRYFVSLYTDGPATRWNVIDRRTQEWVQRFATEDEANANVVLRTVTDELLGHGEFSSMPGQNRVNAEAAAKAVIDIVRRHLPAGVPAPAARDTVLEGIGEALESRGYVGMTNGRDIGRLLDELEQLRAASEARATADEAISGPRP